MRCLFIILVMLLSSGPASARVIPLPRADVSEILTRGLDGLPTAGAGRAVLFHGLRVEVEPSGTATTTEHRIERVLTLKGCRDLAVLWFAYDPASNQVEPLSVLVHRENGEVITVDPGQARDVPALLHSIYWPFRGLALQLPRLLPGDSVEWVLRRRGFSIAYLGDEDPADPDRFVPPMRGHFYDTVLFAESVPLIEKLYELLLPPDRDLRFGTFGGPVEIHRAPTEEGGTRYRFTRRKVPALASAPRAPAPSDEVPKVVLATISDWREKSQWFHQVNEPMFAHDQALRDATAEILRGAKTDDERILRLLRWVAREIRYSGLQVIRGEGYTLHPGLLTWEHRAGVCKDIAGMLVTMMRAAGYAKTWPAMTMAGARVEDVPADQFNHCVVAWERSDGDYVMLDPTWAPWSRFPWSLAESEQQFLVGAPLGDVLRTTPALAPSDNTMDLTMNSRLRKDGTLETHLALHTTGFLETAVRRGLVGRPLARRLDAVLEIARDLSPAAVLEDSRVRPEDLEDLDAPLTVDLDLVVPNWATSAPDGRLVFVPASFKHPVRNRRLWENLLITDAATRTRGISFTCPKELRLREELRLPAGFRLERPLKGTRVETSVGSSSWSLRMERGDRLIIEQRAVFNSRRIPEDRLKEFQRVVAPLQALETTPVVLVPEVVR